MAVGKSQMQEPGTAGHNFDSQEQKEMNTHMLLACLFMLSSISPPLYSLGCAA